MKIISQRDARKDFFKIAQEVNERSIPVMVAGKDSMDDVVILAKADYDASKLPTKLPTMNPKKLPILNPNTGEPDLLYDYT